MAVAIEIPAPRPGDSAQVVTSLENAALFGRIGDSEEALRWLQRAAESAGETGDDERTLVLARMASELSSSLRPISGTAPLNGERRLPTPPPRSRPVEATPSRPVQVPASRPEAAPAPQPAEARSIEATPARPVETRSSEATPSRALEVAALQPVETTPSHPGVETALHPDEVAPRSRAPADTGATDEPTLLLTRPLIHKTSRPPTAEPASVAPRPPPPSSRPQTARPPQLSSHQLPAPTVSTAPKPPAASTAPAADAHPPSSVTPVSPTSVASLAPAPASLAPAPASLAPAPAPLAPAPASVAPSSTPTSAVWRPARVRQAARVSVEKSKSEPGLYLVRLLDEGKSPDAGRTEALLVSIDPGVGLF